jgi:hypothetical protein
MFCSELLLFLKKPTGMGFSPSQNFFSTSSLDINFFAHFVEKTIRTATARNSYYLDGFYISFGVF